MEEKTEEAADLRQKRSVALLRKLSRDEAFVEWRDLCAKPVLDQIDAGLANPMEMSEATIKAQVAYRNLVKALFYRLFDEMNQLNLDGELPGEG